MKKLVLLAILGTVATASVWSWKRTSEPVATDNRLFADRIWIDHIPRNDRDTINVFAAISDQSIGVFQATSQWRGGFEAFRYEASAGDLRIVYPQTGDRDKARVKARRCNEGQMDFCLEIDGASRGVKKYYSREGWEIGAAHDLDAVKQRVEAVRTQLTPAS
ncbi:MAG TPA: hypothetical protein VLM79_35190 [Kofleriaceae bacterium]|nr:hypothetical protein [Kofleriaceae bacterium]